MIKYMYINQRKTVTKKVRHNKAFRESADGASRLQKAKLPITSESGIRAFRLGFHVSRVKGKGFYVSFEWRSSVRNDGFL